MKEYGVTLLRVVLGVIYAMHGYLALVVLTPAGTARFLGGVIALPAPLPTVAAWILIVVHGAGGILLILGLRTRWAAGANAIVMAVALVRVHLHQGFFLAGAGDGRVAGYEYVLLLLGATVALVLIGPGAWAAGRS